jgi:hypothetical protein
MWLGNGNPLLPIQKPIYSIFFKLFPNIFVIKSQMCLNGICQSSPSAPTGSCVYPEASIIQNDIYNNGINFTLTSPMMTCNGVLSLMQSLGIPPMNLCSQSDFNQRCCGTCASKNWKEMWNYNNKFVFIS